MRRQIKALLWICAFLLYWAWFQYPHRVHCTPIDTAGADAATQWHQSRLVDTPISWVAPLLCGALGEQHSLVALTTHADVPVARYEYSPRHSSLLIDYQGPARLLRFRSVCLVTRYTQECLIEVRAARDMTTRSVLYTLSSALVDSMLLLFYGAVFLFAVLYTLYK